MMEDYYFEELEPGTKASLEVMISDLDIQRFADISGDVSPIHVDDHAARARGYRGKIAHGALLTAHVSRLIGVQLPGQHGVLQRLEMEFRRPCYAGTRLRIVGEVTRQIESVRVIAISITITDVETNELLANGRVQSSVVSRQHHQTVAEAHA